MLTVIRDWQGDILAVVEWRRVDNDCRYDTNGNNIWVHTIEVNESSKNKGLIYEIIRRILVEMPEAKYCWFRREKYNHRVRGYKREKWEKLIKEVNYVNNIVG